MRTSSVPNIIVIIIDRFNEGDDRGDTLLLWDVIENCEYGIYDVKKPYEILFDQFGNPYVVTKEKTYFGKERCAISCYGHQELKDIRE